MKRLEVFLLPLDGMLVHLRSLPRNLLGFPNSSQVPIYIPGRREALCELGTLPKNTTQCPRPALEPGPLAPESCAPPGGWILPYKGLMGTCGQPGYVFRDFCLKQGIEFIIFCLNQGVYLSIFVFEVPL